MAAISISMCDWPKLFATAINSTGQKVVFRISSYWNVVTPPFFWVEGKLWVWSSDGQNYNNMSEVPRSKSSVNSFSVVFNYPISSVLDYLNSLSELIWQVRRCFSNIKLLKHGHSAIFLGWRKFSSNLIAKNTNNMRGSQSSVNSFFVVFNYPISSVLD